MAGTLPGVEAARRRRFHHSSSDQTASWIRKSSFRHEFFPTGSAASSSSSALRSSSYVHEHYKKEEMLGGVAREAKERLDEKLRNQRAAIPIISTNFWHANKQGAQRVAKNEEAVKRSGTKRLMGWAKLGWKAGEQEECTICLETFDTGEGLVTLPCAHRFHSKCLVPWIESNAHCPCCRMTLS